MAQSFEESLFQAIKKDDKKAFGALMEKARCGAYRMGRFPVLSLLYLYKSRRLISAYEEEFLKITDFTELKEPAEVSKKFAPLAGKCLRLYLNEVVSPVEMLLILDKTKRLKRVYPAVKPSAAVKERLKSIYSIKYSLSVRFEGDDIILDRRPLSYREKKNIAVVCMCAVMAVTVAVGVPLIVTMTPDPVEGGVTVPGDTDPPADDNKTKPYNGEVTELSQIDFSSENEYTLKGDVVLPENYSVKKVNCSLSGGKLIFGKGASLGEFGGKMSGVTIESSGTPLFTSVSASAAIENVTVNVAADLSVAESSALVAVTNYGTIDGVILNVRGKINAVAGTTDELVFGGLVLNNSYNYRNGTIKNCTVNYSQFELVGETGANAAFGGVAGVNYGYLQDCKVTGEIKADTFDLAGVCYVNNGVLLSDENGANLLQSSENAGWNPITCGIVLNNTYAVEKCLNRGKISSAAAAGQADVNNGTAPVASVAGIVYLTSNTVVNCTNSGEVSAKGFGEAYAGGIASHSYARIYNCISDGGILVTAEKVYAGGILGYSEVDYEVFFGSYRFAWGEVFNCISKSKIEVLPVDENTPAYVGGIVGFIEEKGIDFGDEKMYFGGGVTRCYFTGECTVADVAFAGGIAGGCGAHIYESNSFVDSSNTEYHNFEGNVYLNNSASAFGAVVTDDGESASAEDKGATKAPLEEIENSEGFKSILNSQGQ